MKVRNQKLFGMLFGTVLVLFATQALAADEAVKVPLGDEVKKWLAVGAGFAIALASFGGALGQARAIASAVDGIARNPGAAGKIFAPTLIVGLALIESLVLYAWIVALQLSGKI
ncbi:MAG: ATP synthase F0 subunit C [Pseudomonadota bacterium]